MMISIGDNIKIARKKKGFTQEELANQIGVTPQAVSRWESGSGMPDISLIVPIAQVLSVSTDRLFGLEGEKQDSQQMRQIMDMYRNLETKYTDPRILALEKCNYLEQELDRNLGNAVIATCLVERTAELSRYVDFEDFECDWEHRKSKAIGAAMQVIRFCSQKEWVERTHFALAWIYIHEKDFASAKEHIKQLPSVKNNCLQESILMQAASLEYGLDEMKVTLVNNLQNMVRAMNKEIIYAVENMSWTDEPENAISFAKWGIGLMDKFCEKREMIPYCRGFYRDTYKFMIHADLRKNDYEMARKHWNELCDGMHRHYEYYQEVLAEDALMDKFNERQIQHMRAYTEEFMMKKQEEIKNCLKEWHKEESEQFLDGK